MSIQPKIPHDDLHVTHRVLEGAQATYVCDLVEPDTLRPTAPPIVFHKGSPEGGWHGWTTAHALRALIQHMEFHQGTPFACPENEEILQHLQAALEVTKRRAAERKERGVLYDHRNP